MGPGTFFVRGLYGAQTSDGLFGLLPRFLKAVQSLQPAFIGSAQACQVSDLGC